VSAIHVGAGKTMLEALIRTPEIGLCELVWNAFDEDARLVRIRVETNNLGGVEALTVEDDGNGINQQRAETSFSNVGNSWKLIARTKSKSGRAVDGK
jgi:hypothetical protein